MIKQPAVTESVKDFHFDTKLRIASRKGYTEIGRKGFVFVNKRQSLRLDKKQKHYQNKSIFTSTVNFYIVSILLAAGVTDAIDYFLILHFSIHCTTSLFWLDF